MFSSNKKRKTDGERLDSAAVGILFRELLERLDKLHPGLVAEMTAEVKGNREFARSRKDLFDANVDMALARALAILGQVTTG